MVIKQVGEDGKAVKQVGAGMGLVKMLHAVADATGRASAAMPGFVVLLVKVCSVLAVLFVVAMLLL